MSGIVNGRFVKGAKPSGGKVNAQYKNYRHDMQRLDHRQDLIQPHKNGHANPEFIQAFPDTAQKYFSKEDIYKYGNN